MSQPLACCVDVPRGGGLVRYGLTELLRGLGRTPAWVRREDARLLIAQGDTDRALEWSASDGALEDLVHRRVPTPDALGWTDVDGQRWPVPVGGPGEATLGTLAAAAGWWLAGVQEVSIRERDAHQRFPYARSLQAALANKPGGPLRPAVDAYRRRVAGALERAGVSTQPRSWGGAAWAVGLTHDLDAVRTRRLRAGLGSLARGRPVEAVQRMLGPDRRRESIHALHALARRHEARATWFVKPAAWTPEDVPGGLDPTVVRTLRQWRESGDEIGWHPGYGTLDRPDRLAVERDRFERAFGGRPRVARTHYLRWTPQGTGRHLAEAGVTIDSTLGFAEQPGFRRGTAVPFPLYDLAADRPTDVWEMPLAVMDTTLTDYQSLSAQDLAQSLRSVTEAAQAVGGVAVVLWHNQIGGETAAWTAGLDALDREIGHARERGAAIGGLKALLNAWSA